jgi:hypothetical protein
MPETMRADAEDKAGGESGEGVHFIKCTAAMPATMNAAVATSERGEQARGHEHAAAGLDARVHRVEQRGKRRRKKPEHEGDAPRDVAATHGEQPAHNPAHSGHAAVEEHEHRCGEPDERSTRRGSPGSEVRPVDGHAGREDKRRISIAFRLWCGLICGKQAYDGHAWASANSFPARSRSRLLGHAALT